MSSRSADDPPSDSPGGDRAGKRSRVPPQRVTLQFAGPKLALPGETVPGGAMPGDEPDDQALHLDTLHLDTSELEIPPAEPETEPPSLELDLEGLEGGAIGGIASAQDEPTDGWGRLRAGIGDPGRGRSVTPARALLGSRGDDALSLVSERSRPPSTPGIDLGSEMSDRYALGDFTGALRVAELLLGRNPDDVRAQKCAESSRERLIQLYSARLRGPAAGSSGGSAPGSPAGEAAGGEGGGHDPVGDRVPRVRVPDHEIRWLGLDHRQGFLLSRLDGASTIEDLVDLSGMTRLEVLRTLVELVEAGAIELS